MFTLKCLLLNMCMLIVYTTIQKFGGSKFFFYALKHFLLSVLNTFVENAILHFLPGFFAELKVQKNSIYLKYIFLYVKDFVTFDQFNASLNVH